MNHVRRPFEAGWHRNGRAARAIVALAMVLAGVAGGGSVAHAGGGAYTFPANCLNKIQDCIDLATAGDTVFVAADGFIEEYLVINSGITLTAKAGFHPTVLGVRIWADTGTIVATVAGLRMTRGVNVSLYGGSGHRVVIRNVIVDQPSDVDDVGILLSASVPTSFVLEGDRVHTESTNMDSVSVGVQSPGGLVSLRVESNQIDQVGAAGNAGIRIQGSGAGQLRADILNTTIWDVAAESSGGGAGITLYFSDTMVADVNVIGVTLEHIGSSGIGLRNDVVAGGHLDLDVFDSVFSRAERSPIVFDPAGLITFRAGYNDAWRNGDPFEIGGRSMGPGHLRVDPRFVDRAAGNLRLRSDSPLIDRGVVCSPGGVGGMDAAGRARLAGASVDIGAFERGAASGGLHVDLGDGAADELTGTAGIDILCGYGGPDTLRGAGAGDWLDGGKGPDRLVGGGGRDRMLAGDGNDTLCAKDGKPGDRLNGGRGTDQAVRDAGDTLVSIEGSGGCFQ